MPGLPKSVIPESLVAPAELHQTGAVHAGWTNLVQRIRSGDTDGMEELYQLFSRGIRFYFSKRLDRDDVDDEVHDAFLSVVQAIRRGELAEPERLMSLVRTIVRTQVASHIALLGAAPPVPTNDAEANTSRQENPAESMAFHERKELIERIAAQLGEREHEILTRFYVREQSADQICSEMSLTETQFRLLKSRAKARFRELGNTAVHPGTESHHAIAPPGSEARELIDSSVDMNRLVPVIAHAVAVFGDEEKASHWLTTRLPLLGDCSPSQLLERQDGLDLVEQTLTRIEHNIPS